MSAGSRRGCCKVLFLGRGAVSLTMTVILSMLPLSTHAESWRVVPQVAVIETMTDNVNLGSSGNRRSEAVTEVVPSIRINGSGARAKLDLDYRLSNLVYAREPSNNATQNFLNLFGSVEAIEQWFFVEARANISQQSVSAFSSTSTNNVSIDPNRTETSTYRLSPYIKGNFGSHAEYRLSYQWDTSTSKSSQISGTDSRQLSAMLKSDVPSTRLSWIVEGNSNRNSYEVGTDTQEDRIGVTLSYRTDPQLTLSILAGRERNDYIDSRMQSKTTSGAGFEWFASERTTLSGRGERRFFGTSHNLLFRHRTPRTAWSFQDSKTITLFSDRRLALGQVAGFDLLYSLLSSRIPDPVVRTREVERLLDQGVIPAELSAPGALVSNQMLLERRQEGACTLLGSRDTLTLRGFRVESEAFGSNSGIGADLNLAGKVRQIGFAGGWSHLLSPQSALNLTTSWQQNKGNTIDVGTRQWSFQLQLSTHFGSKTVARIGARHIRFGDKASSDSGYRENALTAVWAHSF